MIPELAWNQNHEKWGERFDIWGIRCPQCDEIMHTDDGRVARCPKHPDETYDMPETTVQQL